MKRVFTHLILLIFFVASNLPAQINWTKHPDPVLSPGPVGEWDENFAAVPSVLFDGSTYHMWYTSYDFVSNRPNAIGYATSNDGISWTKYDDTTTTNPPYSLSDPVLTQGPEIYDNHGLGQQCVIKVGTTYHMWYGGHNNPADNKGYTICHATSSDGITWNKDPDNPVLDVGLIGSWDDTWLNDPKIVFDGSIYHMWYSAWDGNYPPDGVIIGHATATHPDSTWTKDPRNPVLDIGSLIRWDYDRVEAPDVVFDGYRFHMFYSGGYIYNWRIGYAWSTDGTHWTKYDNPGTTTFLFNISDPVLFWGSVNSWDDTNVSHCSVLLDTLTKSLKMWYSGSDAAPEFATVQVGYATAPFDTSFTGIKVLNTNYPKGYLLQQNYPNPFNPCTTIEFQIPSSQFVTLKIYNLLGQEVATLVSEKLNAGNYKYDWDAGSLASGVYYYQLKTRDNLEIKKMILLK